MMRVLDLSQLFPGPYCSRILADFGSEVIKVERPGGGDWLRYVPPLDPQSGYGQLFRALNRGKKSLVLDLKSGEGRHAFLRLSQTADVLLEGFRPGVMDRLGLGYARLAQGNPRLVYCALTGYGPEGPYQDRAGHDLNYLAAAGALHRGDRHQRPPTPPTVPIADLTGALWAAIGILLALLERERTGLGQRVDSSLFGAAFACLSGAVARHRGGTSGERAEIDLTGGQVCYNVYETKDGRHVTLAALEPQFWAAFCRAVGREDLLAQQFAAAAPGQPAYEQICILFRTRTRDEWGQLLAGVDACCEPVFTLGEALASEPVRALKMLSTEGLLPPVHLSAREPGSNEPAPALGQHTAQLLRELGFTADQTEQFARQGIAYCQHLTAGQAQQPVAPDK